jgi:putative ABC transport system permease protein
MWLSRIVYDVRAFVTRRSMDQQLESDIEYHLEREEQLHIARGVDPVEARRRAAATFGGARQTREAALDVSAVAALESVWRDVRYAVRSLRKRPVFTTAVVATLALGIGATTTVFTLLNAVLLRPLPFEDPGQLVAIWEHDKTRAQRDSDHEEVAPANLADWLRASRTIAAVSTYGIQRLSVTSGDETEEVSASAVSWSHFALLGVHPLLGRAFAPRDSEPGNDPIVILNETLWRRRFGGDSTIIGRSVLIGGASKTVVGVVPSASAFPRGVELWTPRTPTAAQLTVRSSHYLRVIARLQPGASVEDAQLELGRVAERLTREYPESNAGRGVNVVGLQDDEAGSVRRPLLMLFVAVAFVMLVACANIGGLFMARSVVRAGELALRVTLGAGRRRIMQQLLAECLLVSAVGAAIGITLAVWGTHLLIAASPADLSTNGPISLDTRAIVFAIALALVAILLFGVTPAIASSRRNLYDVLKAVGRQSSSVQQSRGRRLLVAGELALTTMLLVGAGLMVRSLVRLQDVDLGFRSSHLLTAQVHLPGARYPGGTKRSEDFYTGLLRTLHQNPGIESASAVFMLPFANDNRVYSVRRVGQPTTDQSWANFRVAMPGYFTTIHVPLLSGRDFAASDTAGAPQVVLVNQTMAKQFWPGQNAIGKRVIIRSATVATEVIGVVGDMKYFAHDAPPSPEMFVPHAQVPVNDMTVVMRTRGDPAAVMGLIARAVRAMDAQVPLGRVSTMTQLVDDALAVRRFTRMLLTAFAVVGLLLSGIGLYGLIAYSVAQRTHEIGVRIALGATASDVLALVAGGGVRLVLTGIVIGAAGSLMLGRALGTLVFGVSIADPIVLAVSATVLLVAAIGAMLVPALNAARVNPVISLRS